VSAETRGDAALRPAIEAAERAECVMLSKGLYVVEAVRLLDDILVRMQAHQEKKTSMLCKLKVAATFASEG